MDKGEAQVSPAFVLFSTEKKEETYLLLTRLLRLSRL